MSNRTANWTPRSNGAASTIAHEPNWIEIERELTLEGKFVKILMHTVRRTCSGSCLALQKPPHSSQALDDFPTRGIVELGKTTRFTHPYYPSLSKLL